MRIATTSWAYLVAAITLQACNQIATGDIERRYPPIGDFVDTPAARLHYLQQGSGCALVLLHGARANLRDYTSSIAPLLSEDHRTIAFDRPGHGYSQQNVAGWLNPDEQAALLLQALDHLGVQRAIWVGHSWAGSVVMAGLLGDSERVVGGVLIAGLAYPWKSGAALSYRLPQWPIVGWLFSRTLLVPVGRARMEASIRSVFYPDSPSADYQERAGVELALRPGDFRADGRDVTRLSAFLEAQSERYASISQPLLLIHGTADETVPAWNHADRLLKVLPRVTLLEFPGTGHLPHHVYPQRVAAAIRAFAARTLACTRAE
jgi:pimeloyl-ACP methyl ester carboxylesterase